MCTSLCVTSARDVFVYAVWYFGRFGYTTFLEVATFSFWGPILIFFGVVWCWSGVLRANLIKNDGFGGNWQLFFSPVGVGHRASPLARWLFFSTLKKTDPDQKNFFFSKLWGKLFFVFFWSNLHAPNCFPTTNFSFLDPFLLGFVGKKHQKGYKRVKMTI